MKLRILLILFLFLSSCAQIPTESIKLNQLVYTNISDIQEKHINLAHEYFALKIQIFDSWFVQEYEPAYRANYEKIWNAKNPNDRLDLNKDTHRQSYVQDSIAEYEELVGRIKVLEQDLVNELNAGYSDVLAANEAVTKLLESAKSINESQKKLWNETVGKIIPKLEVEKIDKAVKEIQDKALAALGAS